MSVLGECSHSSSSRTFEFLLFAFNLNHNVLAFRDLVRPLAAPTNGVVGKTRGAFVSVGFAIETLPEDAAARWVRKGSVKPGTVLGGNRGLQLRPSTALHQMELGTLLEGEGWICVQES